MSTSNPLSSRIEQLKAQITQKQNTPLNQLKAHSEWQQQHIHAIESQLNETNQRLADSEAWAQSLVQRTQELEHQLATKDSYSVSQSANGHSSYHVLEERMLEQIHENAHFMRQLIQQQEKTIQKRNIKINTLQRSFSWQITGPLRAGQSVAKGVAQASQVAIQPVVKVHQYINKRPKLKDNLMKMTGLKDLYTKKSDNTKKVN